MKNFFALLCATIVVTVLSGCQTYFASYDISLKEVVTPSQVKDKYGEQKIYNIDSMGVKRYYFENAMVKIFWLPTSSNVNFTIYNKTDFSIKILWDDAAYLDETGKSHRVMHSGVKYIDRSNPQPPTVIPRRGSIDDLVFPVDNVYFISGEYGGWDEIPLFPNRGQTMEEVKQKAQPYVGKSFQVLLPLSIQDVVNEYTFTFLINNVNYRH